MRKAETPCRSSRLLNSPELRTHPIRDMNNLDDNDTNLRAVVMKCWEEEKENAENDVTFQRIRTRHPAHL